MATDSKGVTTAWCTLANSADLLPAATWLKAIDARLSTITVFQPKATLAPAVAEGEEPAAPPTFLGGVEKDGKSYEIDYHFDLDGDTLTLVAHVATGGAIDSLTELYRAADWPEREIMLVITDVYAREPDAVIDNTTILPACVAQMAGQETLCAEITQAGFKIESWQDHSAVLKTFLARLIFEKGSLAALWSNHASRDEASNLSAALRAKRPGYFLLLARAT